MKSAESALDIFAAINGIVNLLDVTRQFLRNSPMPVEVVVETSIFRLGTRDSRARINCVAILTSPTLTA